MWAAQPAAALVVETDAVCGARAVELCRGLGETRVFDPAVTDLARAHEEFGKGGTAGSRLILHTMP